MDPQQPTCVKRQMHATTAKDRSCKSGDSQQAEPDQWRAMRRLLVILGNDGGRRSRGQGFITSTIERPFRPAMIMAMPEIIGTTV